MPEQPPDTPTQSHTNSSDSHSGESDDDDESEDSPQPRWHHIEEDKSSPCEDELKYIRSRKEHSALDHAYWQKRTFFDLNDPELLPTDSGRIDWLVTNFNGTKEHPTNVHLMTSQTMQIGGLDWHIKFYPKGNHSDYLSVYIECVSMLSPDFAEFEDFLHPPFPFLKGAPKVQHRRSVAAQISVVMYNPAEPRVYEYRSEAHQFHKKSADYGWKYFTRLPRYEFHMRQHTQRQAILRDDKLAFSAYIRVVEDPTRCMWEHGTRSAEEMTTITGLRPFMKSSHSISVAMPLLHFRPFRLFVCGRVRRGEVFRDWLQPLLLKMYSRKRSALYGSYVQWPEGDVMELMWRMSKGVAKELSQHELGMLEELVGNFHPEKGTPCSTNRLNTKDFPSIQDAVNHHDKFMICPDLLTLELQRQEHDKKTRKWTKLTNKVRVEDHICVHGMEYTLFAFITHTGHLQSSRYCSYVRPRGIGKGWYAYQDGRVTRLTEKQARDKHSGPVSDKKATKSADQYIFESAFGEFDQSCGEVTCVVMYVRDVIAQDTFSFHSTELWTPPTDMTYQGFGDVPTTPLHLLSTIKEYESSSPLHDSHIGGDVTPIHQTLGARTPEPLLLDGEDVVMRDAEDDDDDPAFSLGLAEGEVTPESTTANVGTIDWLGRPYYQGQFHNFKYHGGGHLISCNGDEYLGSFRKGLQDGYGKMIYSTTGDVYEGEWLAGEHHGHGKLTEHSTGNVFEGGWQHGRKHGDFVLKGTVTDEDKSCCTICYSREMTTAFYDCGHVVACRECAAMVDNCPVCRKRVMARLQLYGVKMTWA